MQTSSSASSRVTLEADAPRMKPYVAEAYIHTQSIDTWRLGRKDNYH